MLKKSITYINYNDEEVTEDFYFNINKAELMELELSTPGGFSESIKAIVAEKNVPLIMSTFKKLILKSYGEKSPDGKHFSKSEEISNKFENTEAYSSLFMELVTDAQKAGDFVTGILPKDIQDEAKTKQKELLENK